MGGLTKSVLLSILLTLPPMPALGWAPETRVRMVDEAVRLMPLSLRKALEGQRQRLLHGMLAPMTNEGGPEHRPPWAAGRLEEELQRAAARLADTLRQPTAFGDVAERFGDLAHYVADAGFPPGASKENEDQRYRHFSAFCESRRERFPLVFYGHEDAQLEAGGYRSFGLRVMQLASVNDRELARAYAAAGDPPDPAAFDDRSVPFAIGSLAYSQSITHIVRIWIDVWQRAGGDTGRTPYTEQTESQGG